MKDVYTNPASVGYWFSDLVERHPNAARIIADGLDITGEEERLIILRQTDFADLVNAARTAPKKRKKPR